MVSSESTDQMNRVWLEKKDILAISLLAILVTNIIFTLAFTIGLYSKYLYVSEFGSYHEYSSAYIAWGILCLFSFALSVFWTYIHFPLNRWSIFALIISIICLFIFLFPEYLLVPPRYC